MNIWLLLSDAKLSCIYFIVSLYLYLEYMSQLKWSLSYIGVTKVLWISGFDASVIIPIRGTTLKDKPITFVWRHFQNTF